MAQFDVYLNPLEDLRDCLRGAVADGEVELARVVQ